MLPTALGEVVARDGFTDVNHSKLECAATDDARVVQPVAHVALMFVVHPQQLVLPVLRFKAIEVVELVDVPVVIRCVRRARFDL